eukprot:13700221-Alexandrium_andersonii.AAC.1
MEQIPMISAALPSAQSQAALPDAPLRWDAHRGTVVDHNGVPVSGPSGPMPLALPSTAATP